MRHRTGMCVLMMILGLSLSACGGAEGGNRAEQLALDIRGEYLEMGGCTASLELTADYGQRVYTYGIGLNYASEGRDLSFKEPFRIDTPVWYLARRSNLCERNGAMSLRVSNPCESAGERISLLRAA